MENSIYFFVFFIDAFPKSDNRDKVLLTSSMADQKEENKRYRETHHQIFNNGEKTSGGEGGEGRAGRSAGQ